MKNMYQNLPGLSLSLKHLEKFVITLFIFLALTICLTKCAEDPGIMPKLNTLEAIDSDIDSTTATLRGEILKLGNKKIIEYGIEYSKSVLFSPSQTKGYTAAPLTGIYQVEVTNLEPKTLYYFKAYVLINTADVYSENVAHFTTK
jgi:hypothetical protein